MLGDLCHDLLTTAAPRRCLGVGVSVPGAVRATDGTVRMAPNLGWYDAPFAVRFSEVMGCPWWWATTRTSA